MVAAAPERRVPAPARRPAPSRPAPAGSGAPHGSNRADLFAVALLLALTALVAWNRLSVDLWLSRHDLLTFFLPWDAFLGEQLRAGNIPGWNPHLFAGTPFAADPESGWWYLPAMLFFPFLPTLAAFKAMVVFQLVVAGLATYAFARVLGLGPVAGLVAAVVFAFGPFLHHDTYCCTVRAQLAAWVPLALLGVELALRAGGWRGRVVPWFVGGFAISQMFAGWLGQGTVNGLLVVAAFLGYRTVLSPAVGGRPLRERLPVGVVTGVAVVGLGLALGAAGVLPRLDVSRDTLLGGGDYAALGQPHAATPYTLPVLLAHLLGDGYAHRAVAVGGAALVLALLAPFVARGRFAVPFFAGLTLVVFTLTQETTPLHPVFYLLPRFRSLHEHSPHQINAVVMIGPAILSAATVEALPRWRGRRHLLPVVVAPLLLVGAVWLALAWGGRGVGWPPLAAAAVVTGLVALAVAVRDHGRPSSPAARVAGLVPALILAVAFVQPTGQEIVESALGRPLDPSWDEFWRPNPALERAIAANVAESDPGGAGAFLQARRDESPWPFRQVGYGGIEHPSVWPPLSYQDRRTEPTVQALLVNGRPMFLGLREIQGYNPIQLRRYAELVAALNGREQNYHAANLLPGGVRSPLLDLLGVRYLLLDATLPPDREDVAALTAGRQAVFRNADVAVYENPAALPGAWIVHDVRTVERGAALAPLASRQVDPRRTALIEGAVPAVSQPADPSAESARITRFEPDAIAVATETTAPGLLVVNEIYDRGWRATIDGQPAAILPTNHVQRGVALPAGAHRVELRYDPPALRIGLAVGGVSGAAMLAVLAAAGRARVRRSRSEAGTPGSPRPVATPCRPSGRLSRRRQGGRRGPRRRGPAAHRRQRRRGGIVVDTLKVGIAGAGGIAEQHGVAWRANAPRGEIVAVADVAEARARSFADRYTGGQATLYDGIEALLADPNVDAVDICLPHHLHTSAIVAAARAGRAILCEKPLCTSLEDAAAIAAALRESGAAFVMAHNQLFQPSLVEARRLLAAGAIGRPFLYRSIEAFQNRAALAPIAPAGMAEGESPWAWRFDPMRMGGGEILDTGWHATYRLLALAGDDRPVAVQAMTERFFLPNWPAEDTGLLLVRFASGAIGEILTSWAFASVDAQQFEAMGEHGSLAGSGARLLHQLHRWPRPAERVDDPVHTFTAEVTHFLDVVQNGAESLAPVATGARVLQLTTAAYLAAAEGRQVELPESPLEAGR